MPSLRLLNEWPWGCARGFSDLPPGNFEFSPAADNYWLGAQNLTQAMRWYYKAKSWEFTFQVTDLSGNPVSNAVSGTGGFASETDVVCGRSGLKIAVNTGPWLASANTATATLYLFTAQPTTSQQNFLLNEHSVLLAGSSYKVFCCIIATFASNTGGGTLAHTGLSSRSRLNLTFDGSQVLTATSTLAGIAATAEIRVASEFTFL
jgi:hypothetical protein